MLILRNIRYTHPNRDLLFENIQLTLPPKTKAALIGNNGVGKSSLLKIIAGGLAASGGEIVTTVQPFYIPQHLGQYDQYTIAEALQVHKKLQALQEILAGDVSEKNLLSLDDDWAIEEKITAALNAWHLPALEPGRKMQTLSGGEKTKVFLAAMTIHQPELMLMDEPSNHLDLPSRLLLYDFVRTAPQALLIVSHDRTLLNILDTVYEMTSDGINIYGGNYEFYHQQKSAEKKALEQDLRTKEKELRAAKLVERETMERQQKLDARGRKKQEKAGVPTIMLKTLKNSAEKSTAQIKQVHAEKMGGLSNELNNLRAALPDTDRMRLGFEGSALHRGKILVEAKGISFAYARPLWAPPLQFQVNSGDRFAITGPNGSGKTTLIKLILGELEPIEGTIYRAPVHAIYVDQNYSLIDNTQTVYSQAQLFNASALEEHEVKTRLDRFLFTKESWEVNCALLSGGEKMRLMLCCLTLMKQAPDIIILDEPTNNLDIQNVEILTNAIREYTGTLLVISHDSYFLEQVQVKQFIQLQTSQPIS